MKQSQTKKRATIEIDYLGDHKELIPRVADWIYNEWFFLYSGRTARYIETLVRERVHKRRLPITLVAFKVGKPVGTVSLKEFEIDDRRDLTPWIASLYVIPGARKHGVGSSLVRAAQDQALHMGFKRLFLFTADPGLASRFYSRFGWK